MPILRLPAATEWQMGFHIFWPSFSLKRYNFKTHISGKSNTAISSFFKDTCLKNPSCAPISDFKTPDSVSRFNAGLHVLILRN